MSRVSRHPGPAMLPRRAASSDISTRTAGRPMMARERTRGMSKKTGWKGASGTLAALVAATAMSCSPARPPAAAPAFKSVGRGAPVSPAIPAETWVVPDNIEPFPPAEIKGYPEQDLAGRPVRGGGPRRRGGVHRLRPERRGAGGDRAARRRPLHLEGLLQGPGTLVRQTLFPVQQSVRARGAME